MNSRLKFFLFFWVSTGALYLCCLQQLRAQALPVTKQIDTRFGPLVISANAADWYNNKRNNIPNPVQAIIHLKRLPSSYEQQQLEATGIKLLRYIDKFSYTALIEFENKNTIIPEIVYGFSDFKKDWKIAPDVLINNKHSDVCVSVLHGTIENDFIQFCISLGLQPKKAIGNTYYLFAVSGSVLLRIAEHYTVSGIALYREPSALNFEAKCVTKANEANLPIASGGYNLRGKGVVIGIGDNMSGIGNIDLKDRILANNNPQPYTNHGVHINGIAGGAGIGDIKVEGVAPMANFVNHFFSQILESTTDFYNQYNMTITNNSYAAVIRDCNYAGVYNAYAEATDVLALKHKDVLHVFAAGNDGLINCAPYPAGFGTVVGAYQTAKNCLVVTSIDKRYNNAVDGGRGPIRDGRLKPEITAVGVDVRSTNRVDSYYVSGGTSMASPGVAGGAALLTERYKQINGAVNPRADVLKALLMNGATDIGNPGPDYRYGFGFMNLPRSLIMLENNRVITNSVAHGNQQVHSITIPPNTAQLKVMLYWHDAVASTLASKQLVNDLDLVLSTPSSAQHRPLILDPTPDKILNNALEGVDRLNNVEQIVVNNPATGTYTVIVNGFNVPSPQQDYVLVYDFVPLGLKLTYPTTGAQVKTEDSLRIYWDASDNNNTQKLEITTDAGNNWSLIADNIASAQRHYVWWLPQGISSGKCRIRISRNNTGEQHSTGNFAINSIPQVTLDANQCPGYIKINWNSITNAAGYEVMMKQGAEMRIMDTTNSTTYTFAGLHPDSMYYVAVRPLIDGLQGYRSLAVKRKPFDGDCSGNISDGDMAMVRAIKPLNGRLLTSTALTSNTLLEVMVRNLDDNPINNFRISYSINGSTWKAKDYTISVPARDFFSVIVDTLNLSAPGVYSFIIAVNNLSATDIVRANDTIRYNIKQMNNFPIDLTMPMVNDFEDWTVLELINPASGISPDERWDYNNANDTCRLRSFVKPDITIKGSRSVSLDATYNTFKDQRNELSGTFNLANYNANNEEIRLEFDYKLHGYSGEEDSNKVYVRGNDTQPWQPLHAYDKKCAATGKVTNSGSLSLTDAMLAAKQNFSTSTQFNFVQSDISLIGTNSFGRGFTMDNLKVYTVQNDAQLLSIVSPIISECGLSGMQPLTIKVRNGVNQVLNNIQLYYKYDDNPVVNETIASLAGKQTITYTFNNKIDLSKNGKHTLSIWLSVNGDTYLLNDSLLNYDFYNQPLIISYPYFENFEGSDGGWYALGKSNSWAYGMPNSQLIKKAASGTKAWKTNLNGNYNVSELSYLYSPCFDITAVKNPYYRFKTAIDIENCGQVLCDGANIEYSTDGINWQRLGKFGDGTNWYNDSLHNVWTIENSVNWQSSSIKLPLSAKALRLRYRFEADLGAEREGLAIDDIEIYEEQPVVVINNLLNIVPNPVTDGKVLIDWTARAGTTVEITLHSISGKLVYQNRLSTDKEGRNRYDIQTPAFQRGVYIIQVLIGDKKFTRKLVYL